MATGIERITAERQRQIEREGWTPEHDDQHDEGELVYAAIAYADCNPAQAIRNNRIVIEDKRAHGTTIYRDPFPNWEPEFDKREKHTQLRRLEIAGALIAAEIDRLERVLASA